MSDKTAPQSGTRREILEVAARLFAERGLDAVSVRDITRTAGANLAAINYYFGSKESLIHEIYDTLLTPIQHQRIALLDRLEEQAGDGPLDPNLVLRALVEPAVRATIGQPGLIAYLPKLMAQAYAVSRPFLDDKLAEESDVVARRFIDAFARAVPDVPHEEMSLRYYFVIGCMLQVTSCALIPSLVRRLSGGRTDATDPDRIVEEIIAFCSAGLRSPAPGHVPQKAAAKGLCDGEQVNPDLNTERLN